VSPAPSRLEALMPEWEVREFHETSVAAPPAAAFAAARAVTAPEVRLFLPQMALRLLPAAFSRRRVAVDLRAPLIDLFVRNGFVLLDEVRGRELVLGAAGRFWQPGGGEPPQHLRTPTDFEAFAEPGYAKGIVNLLVEPAGSGSRMSTETRVTCTDADATRLFRRYWRVISPGSALIRRSWLAAIRRRALQAPAPARVRTARST
jgi:hypothetical protein